MTRLVRVSAHIKRNTGERSLVFLFINLTVLFYSAPLPDAASSVFSDESEASDVSVLSSV